MLPVRRSRPLTALNPFQRLVLAVMLSPYLLARAVYGRGAAAEQLVNAGTRHLPGGNIAQVLAEKIPSVRALVAVGLLVTALRAVVDPDRTWRVPFRWAYATIKDAFIQGAMVMLAAPFVVLVLAAVLVAVARRGHRGAVLRAVVRPAVVSVCGGAVVTLLIVHHVAVWHFLGRLTAGKPVYLPPLGRVNVDDHLSLQIILCWLMLFVLIAPLLVHRNGVGTGRSLPLLPPLATIGVVWLLLLFGLSGDPAAGLTGWRPALDVYGTPVTATLIAVAEILWLRRVKAIGFRGPLPPTDSTEPPDQAEPPEGEDARWTPPPTGT